MKRGILAPFVLCVLLAACAPPSDPPIPSGSANDPIVITVGPFAGLSRRAGDEISTRLEQQTGLVFRLELAASLGDSVTALGAGAAQMGWLDPPSYVVAKKRHAVQLALVAVRDGSDRFTSEIIADARTARSLDDLRGKTFCFSDSTSPAGYAIPHVILRANGIDPSRDLRQVVNAGSDVKVVRAVLNGTCQAGAAAASARRAVSREIPGVMERLHVVDTSAPVANDAWVFVNAFPADRRDKVVAALVDIAGSEEGRGLFGIDKWVQADDSAYNRLRDLSSKSGIDLAQYVMR